MLAVARGSVHAGLALLKAFRLADFNENPLDPALAAIAAGGRSPRTVNAYREVAYSLGECGLRVARILDRNPVATYSKWRESGDKRKQRDSLTVDEARRLLAVAGPRELFYATCL